MTDLEHRRKIAKDLAFYAEHVDHLARKLDAWHWDNAAGIIVAPTDSSREVSAAADGLAAAAQRLRIAAGRHAESVDRLELAERRTTT